MGELRHVLHSQQFDRSFLDALFERAGEHRTRLANPGLLIEMLIPDFRGDLDCVQRVIEARPAVLAHNVETVERLQRTVRDPRANYAQSLAVLAAIHQRAPGIKTKSSIMLGLGETEDEVLETMRDLRAIGVDFLTIGQYLQPDQKKLKVEAFVHPERFQRLERDGLQMGFRYVASGPLVRSSYRAAEFFIAQALRAEQGGEARAPNRTMRLGEIPRGA